MSKRREKQEGHPSTDQGTSGAQGATTVVPQPSVPQTVRYRFDTALRDRYFAMSQEAPPEIGAGTMVELALFGDDPAGYYQYLLANLGCLGNALEDLDGAVRLALVETGLILAEIEQAEAEQRRPDDLAFWTGIIDRIFAVVTETGLPDEAETPLGWYADLPVISRLTGAAGRALLNALVVCCELSRPGSVEPVAGHLDLAKALLEAAARRARSLRPRVSAGVVRELRKPGPEITLPEALSWQCLGTEGGSVTRCDNLDQILLAIDFAVTRMGLSLDTIELGFSGDVVHGIRAVKS